ncbi:TetR/AcrR family transcriptional regulator [Streptomyces sp. NRRL S-87]|uniref:TetR/AcrR family transcriptional regulator n=1 Tax=Streptomyces sp. NRRL S-87 TaxID=1463920 RepID=UPI0004C05772|nr:TetR/AcrR family transcriptional regulator [Streptomyces sp. NRRL S-87]
MTTPQPKAPNAARRNQASRRAILTAAFDLAGELGYGKLSIEAIAARAGVGKQTIYRWWPSKGAVLFDAFLMLSEGGEEDGEPAGLPDTGDLAADLKTVLRATLAELADPRIAEPMRALTIEVAGDPDLAARYAESLDEPVREIKRRRLRAARDAGQLAADVDLDVAIDGIWGPLLNRWLLRTGPLTPAYTDALVDTALRGLRPA